MAPKHLPGLQHDHTVTVYISGGWNDMQPYSARHLSVAHATVAVGELQRQRTYVLGDGAQLHSITKTAQQDAMSILYAGAGVTLQPQHW
jgi:hypothetical protein